MRTKLDPKTLRWASRRLKALAAKCLVYGPGLRTGGHELLEAARTIERARRRKGE